MSPGDLDVLFARKLAFWRDEHRRHRIGSSNVIEMLEELWDATLQSQGRCEADINTQATGILATQRKRTRGQVSYDIQNGGPNEQDL